jgi:hypothetical protein
MKRITDFSSYANILPYASEIFGVYQPMLGWRAKRMASRWDRGFSVDKAVAFESLYKKFKSRFELTLDARKPLAHIGNLKPAQLHASETRFGGSFVMESIAKSLPSLAEYEPSVWDRAIVPAEIQKTLDKVVIPRTQQWHTAALSRDARGTESGRRSATHQSVAAAPSGPGPQLHMAPRRVGIARGRDHRTAQADRRL